LAGVLANACCLIAPRGLIFGHLDVCSINVKYRRTKYTHNLIEFIEGGYLCISNWITNKLIKQIFLTLKCADYFNTAYLRTFSKLNRNEPKVDHLYVEVFTYFGGRGSPVRTRKIDHNISKNTQEKIYL
jgi:hypothetical protein